ncbi:Hypothetical predicted protein, partial [Pelobates cultripes]
KSTFFPRHYINGGMKVFERLVMDEVKKIKKPIYSNISRQQRKAMKELQSDTSIVIKPADKGGGVVILNREQYYSEIYRQLNDSTTYKELKGDPITQIKKAYSELLDRGKVLEILNKKEFEYLDVTSCRTP